MAKTKIFKDLFLLAVVIISYIALIFVISNESFKSINTPVHSTTATEMQKQAVPLQEANFDEIRINKNLLDVK